MASPYQALAPAPVTATHGTGTRPGGALAKRRLSRLHGSGWSARSMPWRAIRSAPIPDRPFADRSGTGYSAVNGRATDGGAGGACGGSAARRALPTFESGGPHVGREAREDTSPVAAGVSSRTDVAAAHRDRCAMRNGPTPGAPVRSGLDWLGRSAQGPRQQASAGDGCRRAGTTRCGESRILWCVPLRGADHPW